MSDVHKGILSPFTGHRKKLGIRLKKNICWYNRQRIILQRGMVRRIFRQ